MLNIDEKPLLNELCVLTFNEQESTLKSILKLLNFFLYYWTDFHK